MAEREEFRLTLTDQEKQYLLDLAKLSILRELDGRDDAPPSEPPTETLGRQLGAFVTLKRRGNLRGCIGNIVGSRPVYLTVYDMARAAAFEDPRFPPLERSEFPELEVDISILGPVSPCPDPELIEIGRHGLIMRQGFRSGLLLPQVPVEWGWDRMTFLAQTCRKASLPPDAWKDPRTEILWFEAEVFD